MNKVEGEFDKVLDPQNQTILIIDDEPANLAVVADYLAQSGFQIKVTQTGEAGLELARRTPPDLILLDVRLPDVDGFEVCRRLKADERTRQIPVIFMTVLTRVEDKVKGFEVGGMDYISKPFQKEEVLARVTTHLRLRDLTQALEDANKGLELRVAERTSELAQTNARLKEEIAERKQAEMALQRLNRELRAISNCNQTLLRAEDEQTLLNDICSIICNDAGYRLAWVGYAEHNDAKTVRPVAWAGVESGYLKEAKITWADTERGHGPGGTAIRSGKSAAIQDFTNDPQAAPWRENALQRGYRSSIALPLKDESAKTFGVLNIYSTEPNAFTLDEMRLLEELAGDLAFGIVVLRTRAERKQAEAALRESEGRYRLLAENASDIIFTMGLDLRFTYISPSVTRILGYTIEEAMANTLDQVLMPASLERTIQVFTEELAIEASESKQLWHVRTLELEQIRKDGSSIWTETTLAPLRDSESQAVGVIGMTRDITKRKRAEEEIRRLNQELEQRVVERTAQLEAANKELEAFAYSVSHDLRAPLRHIDGFLKLFQERTTTLLDEKNQHYMATISDSVRRMGILIDDLLSFSRMGRSEMSETLVDLGELVQDVIQEFKSETEGRDIEWKISPLPWVTGDHAMLRIVLVNLISNALKFTRSRSPAEIEIGWMREQESETVIFVRDNGVGFDMNFVDKLFGVFQRLHHADEFEGTGIGLANVQRIIHRHGGRTWAEGEVNHGATFYFLLPQISKSD